MTTLLTREQVDTLRSIGDGALVLMALWMIDLNYPGRASKSSEIAMYIRKDVRTVEKQLNELCASNRVVNTSAGYILLEGGRALVLEMAPKALALSPDHGQAQVTEVQALEIPAMSAPLSANTLTSPQMEDLHFGGVDCAHNARALKKEEEEEDSTILINLDSSSPSQKDAQNVRFKKLTTENILDECERLFSDGQRLVRAGLDVDLISPAYALGALAHACAEGSRLRNPAGLVYNMLKSKSHHSADFKTISPRKAYLAAPWQYLPKEFAEKFGMAVYDCPFGAECGGVAFSTRAEYDAHMQTAHGFEDAAEETTTAEDAPVSTAELVEAQDESVRMVWTRTLKALADEMPKASFETWARDTFAVRYDGHVLTVGTRNAYARDWLESRMKNVIERLLASAAAFGKPVCVEFVA